MAKRNITLSLPEETLEKVKIIAVSVAVRFRPL